MGSSVAGEKILIVDDGADNRAFIIEHVLVPNGFEYLQASDGAEGLKIALECQPDLILLDLEMPRMKGTQVLEHLAQRGLDIPVVLMTFHGSEDIAVQVYRLGVRDYVKKPYYPQEMLEAIDRALTETRLRREKEQLTERVLKANRELQRRLQEINLLYQIGKSVTSIMNMDELLPQIVDAASQITHAEEGHLCLVDNGQLVCRALINQQMTGARAINKAVQNPLAMRAIQYRKPVVLHAQQLQKIMPGARLSSVVYVPLLLNKRALGVLGVSNYTRAARPFTGDDVALLNALGDYAAIAIQNSRHYSDMVDSRQQVRDTFERFVAPSVVQRVLAKPDKLELGGTRQLISVLFADIRGYTSWSENAEPEQVVETLNHYLSMAAEVILSWEGTLDKFFGDGLMAIFNAPIAQNDHIHRAADAALALMKAANEVNQIHGHRLSYSIGVNVGEAVVGYIGTDRAMNYTAIGDTVNLAKRLQEMADPGTIYVEQEVVRALGQRVKAQPVGDLRVKGRKTAARAYKLVDLET